MAAAPQRHSMDTEEMPAYKLKRRRRILDAALSALSDQDYEQIRISEVAQRAGVAQGTLYRYFVSKDHLYAVVLQDWLANISADQIAPASSAAKDRIRARVHAVIGAFERQPRFFKLLMLLYSSNDVEVDPIRTAIAGNAQRLLARDMDVLGTPTTQDTAIMLWSIISSQLVNAAYHDGSYAEIYRIADVYIDMLPESGRPG
ncbi:TetR/AcrR family transcriptional regulator [Actinocorallia herbida]|nr:TetR/AcrR family transcriptional regulator [Actinocorallia herbida]